jgi:hypothetical protein
MIPFRFHSIAAGARPWLFSILLVSRQRGLCMGITFPARLFNFGGQASRLHGQLGIPLYMVVLGPVAVGSAQPCSDIHDQSLAIYNYSACC